MHPFPVSEDIGIELFHGRSKFVEECTPDLLFVVGDVAPQRLPEGAIDIEGKRERTLYLGLAASPQEGRQEYIRSSSGAASKLILILRIIIVPFLAPIPPLSLFFLLPPQR